MEKQIQPGRAVSMICTGDIVMVGGFGLVGAPLTLIQELEGTDVHDLTIISNNLGEQNKGLGKLLADRKVKKAIGSYFTSNPDVGAFYQAQLLEVELIPQGTLAEAIRAGGAGIGGFLTKTGVGTALAEGKKSMELDGETYLLQKALQADVAIIRAHKADTLGNLVYYKTAQNFNPMMATAAKLVIAEVDEIVEAGKLDPEQIVTPHLFVDYVVLATVKIGGRE